MRRALAGNKDPRAMTASAAGSISMHPGSRSRSGRWSAIPSLPPCSRRSPRAAPTLFTTAGRFRSGATVRGGGAQSVGDERGRPASYDAKERPPACGTYRAWRICGMGAALVRRHPRVRHPEAARAVDLKALGPDSPAAWHLIGESMRLAYADARPLSGITIMSGSGRGRMDPAISPRAPVIAPDRSNRARRRRPPPARRGSPPPPTASAGNLAHGRGRPAGQCRR